MAADTPTPDELVLLAKYCGKEVAPIKEGDSHVWIAGNDDMRFWPVWQPHLDANQRDELVEAVVTDGVAVTMDVTPDFVRVTFIQRMRVVSQAVVLTSECEQLAKRIGLAFCRAALTVIGGV